MIGYSTVTAVVFLCGLLGYTNSQVNTPNTDEVLNKVSNVIDLKKLNASALPDLHNLNTSAIPVLDEAKNLVKQKCDKNGGEGVYEKVLEAKDKVEQCLKSFVNFTQLQEDMEKYKPTGDLDLMFKRYCRKTPTLKNCVNEFTTAIEPCLEPSEKENRKIILNITDSLLSFVCFKEGDRIALFISANGPECLKSKQPEMENCVNTTFGKYMPADPASMLSLETFPSFILGNKECGDISTVQNCIVKELEKCSDPTPANIVDSIFNFILRVTPCKNMLAEQNSASTFTTSLLMMTSLVFVLLRLI